MRDELCDMVLQSYERCKQGLLNYSTSVGTITRSSIEAAVRDILRSVEKCQDHENRPLQKELKATYIAAGVTCFAL
jgi:hypothetical protein